MNADAIQIVWGTLQGVLYRRSHDDHKVVAHFLEKSTFTGDPKLAVPIFEDDPDSVERSQLFLRNGCELSVLETAQSPTLPYD